MKDTESRIRVDATPDELERSGTGEPECEAESFDEGMVVCRKPKGHKGRHEAHMLFVWGDE